MRFPKGSEEAKAWGLKMKKAREEKKSMKGDIKPIGLPKPPPLKMEAPGSKARRGRKPLSVIDGGFLQPGESIPQETQGGSLKTKLEALKAKLQQLKERYK